MSHSEIVFTSYRSEYGWETVKMWRRSFQRALGIAEQDCLEGLAAHLDYFQSYDSSATTIAMDSRSNSIIGLMTLSDDELHHLFVHVDYQGRGLGSKFIKQAKDQTPLGFVLYTFQKNESAQRFYLAHGFEEVERGFADQEENPWAKTKDDLADIKYKWSP